MVEEMIKKDVGHAEKVAACVAKLEEVLSELKSLGVGEKEEVKEMGKMKYPFEGEDTESDY